MKNHLPERITISRKWYCIIWAVCLSLWPQVKCD